MPPGKRKDAIYCSRRCARLAQSAKHYKKNPAVAISNQLRSARIAELGYESNGHCELCGIAVAVPRVDHNHATGKARGYLCHNCNIGLGHFKDSPELLAKAIDYLQR